MAYGLVQNLRRWAKTTHVSRLPGREQCLVQRAALFVLEIVILVVRDQVAISRRGLAEGSCRHCTAFPRARQAFSPRRSPDATPRWNARRRSSIVAACPPLSRRRRAGPPGP